MAGFLMLSREIKSHWIFDDPVKLKAWLVILLEVNYSPKKSLIKGEVLTCEIGESLYSLDTWATKFGKGWNKSSVRRFFDLLKKDEMITLKSETVTTRLTVCNYLKYNKPCNADETQMKRTRNADDTGATPTKEMNKVKKENKESKPSFLLPEWIDEKKWKDFVDMRIKIKKPMTDRAMELAIMKLEKIRCEGHDPNEILDTSTFNDWQDFYPPKKVVTFPTKVEEKVRYL